MSAPVETKVSAATIASAVSGLGLWALRIYVFHGTVPLPVVAAVMTIVPAIITFLAGWLAPHTSRPDLIGPDLVAQAGRHAADEAGNVPAKRYMPPSATRRDSTRRIQD